MSAETYAARPAIIGADARRSLLQMLRTMFPHSQIPDGPYERTVDALLADANASPRVTTLLTQGVSDLDAVAGKPFTQLSESDAYALLEGIQDTPFFALVKAKGITTLYNDQQVWEILGYEGPSFDRGGYINRGFNDLDWLPEPQV
jgi:hypothetical protein